MTLPRTLAPTPLCISDSHRGRGKRRGLIIEAGAGGLEEDVV